MDRLDGDVDQLQQSIQPWGALPTGCPEKHGAARNVVRPLQ